MASKFAIKESGVYTVDRILNILEAAQSLFYFHENWKTIGNYLGVDDAKIKAIHTAYLIGTIETLREVVRQILKAWTGTDTNRATLETLLNILEENKMRRCLEDIVDGFDLVRHADGTLAFAHPVEMEVVDEDEADLKKVLC